jgi:drug/metabolite transporter (DMT)-like permease
MTPTEVYLFLIHLNPILLIIVGVILFFAAKFAKIIGIVAMILGAVLLALPYLLKVV